MFIDTHCHLNFKDFKEDFPEVINRSVKNDVFMIVVGSELKTSTRSVQLADKFPRGVYSAVGLHPIHLQDILIKNDNDNGKYEFRSRAENLIIADYQNIINSSEKVVAVGEIGLDYYHIKADSEDEIKKIKDLQKKVFIEQLNLAQKNNLPVIIHCREAHDDLYEILENFYKQKNIKKEWGVIHCFSGDYDLAQKYFALNLKISFTGLITFNNQWDEVIKKSPLDKIMVETDAPYLAPIPYRGQRNEPVFVKEVIKKIAFLKGLDEKGVEDNIFDNSLSFFSKIKI